MVSRSHALRTDEDMPYRISNTIDTLDVHGTTDGGRGDNMHIYIYLVFYIGYEAISIHNTRIHITYTSMHSLHTHTPANT